ncbi:MAG TPA: NADH-quinone oxidoreductase subunit J [Candidatus Polarisedimenticolia bacterium]|nr:NADH-quinone oxidoreductase subunit J [Candidatus Polarisedimenticolia bacterium]
MHLLSGLIIAIVVFALLRAFLPDRPLAAAVFLVAAAGTLAVLFHDDLLRMEFWAGAVGFTAILSALLIVMHPNPMVSVLFLILNLFCIALFYLMLQAEFLAALQVIIYAGAIMVLFVFVVMLLNLRAEEGLAAGGGLQRWAAIGLGVVLAGALFFVVEHRGGAPFFQPGSTPADFGTAREVGGLLFGRYLFAFEAASVLLVAAMVGAVILAKRRLQ